MENEWILFVGFKYLLQIKLCKTDIKLSNAIEFGVSHYGKSEQYQGHVQCAVIFAVAYDAKWNSLRRHIFIIPKELKHWGMSYAHIFENMHITITVIVTRE